MPQAGVLGFGIAEVKTGGKVKRAVKETPRHRLVDSTLAGGLIGLGLGSAFLNPFTGLASAIGATAGFAAEAVSLKRQGISLNPKRVVSNNYRKR